MSDIFYIFVYKLNFMNVELYNTGNDFGKRLTALEIIEETIEFYSADITRRSIKNGICVYAGEDGTKCAYSRCWKEGVWKEEYEDRNPKHEFMPKPDELVDERYKGHSAKFWLELQRLHDNNSHWNETGLTENGKIYVDGLKTSWA
jgi:hypothetical protein